MEINVSTFFLHLPHSTDIVCVVFSHVCRLVYNKLIILPATTKVTISDILTVTFDEINNDE